MKDVVEGQFTNIFYSILIKFMQKLFDNVKSFYATPVKIQ